MNWSHVCQESLSIPYPQVKTVPAALLFFEFCLIYLSNFLIAQFMTNLNASGGALVRLRLAQCVVPVLTHAFRLLPQAFAPSPALACSFPGSGCQNTLAGLQYGNSTGFSVSSCARAAFCVPLRGLSKWTRSPDCSMSLSRSNKAT